MVEHLNESQARHCKELKKSTCTQNITQAFLQTNLPESVRD